jgi:hypothetical protein
MASAGDNGHVTARPERPRYRVRVEIPRISGTRGWSAAAAAFERGFETQASLLVTERQVELVTRQRRDYVRVSVTVEAAHVAEAAVVAWAMLQQAAGEDTAGWDLAGASAEIRPAGNARLPKTSTGAIRQRQRTISLVMVKMYVGGDSPLGYFRT